MCIGAAPVLLRRDNTTVRESRFKDADDVDPSMTAATFEALTSGQLAAEIAKSTVLTPSDIACVRSVVASFPGGWDVRIVAEHAAPPNANCLYLVNADRANDASLLVAVFVLFDRLNEHLASRGLKVAGGTIVDATIIAASSSTKNQAKARDPETHQARKGQQWYSGMKLHIGVDGKTKLIHAMTTIAASV